MCHRGIVSAGILLADVEGRLKKLSEYLCEDGELVLRQCLVGADEEGTRTLKDIASVMQVKVTAPRTYIRPGFDPGGWKTATPKGTVITTGTETPAEERTK